MPSPAGKRPSIYRASNHGDLAAFLGSEDYGKAKEEFLAMVDETIGFAGTRGIDTASLTALRSHVENDADFFSTKRDLLYGPVKESLHGFVRLLDDQSIDEDAKSTALRELNVGACPDGALENLGNASNRLTLLAGGLAEKLQAAKERFIEQAVVDHCRNRHGADPNYAGNEIHYVNGYMNVMADHFGLRPRLDDVVGSLRIQPEDLAAGQEAVGQRFKPEALVRSLAEQISSDVLAAFDQRFPGRFSDRTVSMDEYLDTTKDGGSLKDALEHSIEKTKVTIGLDPKTGSTIIDADCLIDDQIKTIRFYPNATLVVLRLVDRLSAGDSPFISFPEAARVSKAPGHDPQQILEAHRAGFAASSSPRADGTTLMHRGRLCYAEETGSGGRHPMRRPVTIGDFAGLDPPTDPGQRTVHGWAVVEAIGNAGSAEDVAKQLSPRHIVDGPTLAAAVVRIRQAGPGPLASFLAAVRNDQGVTHWPDAMMTAWDAADVDTVGALAGHWSQEGSPEAAQADDRLRDFLLEDCGEGRTRLHLAARRGSTEPLMALLQMADCLDGDGCSKLRILTALDHGGRSPLIAAVRFGKTEAAIALVDYAYQFEPKVYAAVITGDPTAGQTPEIGKNALFSAIEGGDANMAGRILDHVQTRAPDQLMSILDSRSNPGQNALQKTTLPRSAACFDVVYRCARRLPPADRCRLLTSRPTSDLPGMIGATCLHEAVTQGNFAQVLGLLDLADDFGAAQVETLFSVRDGVTSRTVLEAARNLARQVRSQPQRAEIDNLLRDFVRQKLGDDEAWQAF